MNVSWTYEGTVDILDNTKFIQTEIPFFNGFYELALSADGKRNVIVKKDIVKRMKYIENIVYFRVFGFEFKKSYVVMGGNSAAKVTATIQNCGIHLRSMKIILRDPTTGQFMIHTPDSMFSKMLELIQLLPDDASSRGFYLPWIFLESLPYSLQDDPRDNGYSPPPPIHLLTKSSQLEAMVGCRDKARVAHKKSNDLQKQVSRAMNVKG